LALGLLALPLFVSAQINEQFADMNDTIEMVRSVSALERKAVIARGLQLSGEESTEFWSIYDDYAADKKRVNDRLIKAITDYAANFENLSDELATSLVNDSMKVQADLLKVRKKYLKKLKKVLPPKKLARFYQIENKLDAVANVTIAQGIPLVTD
jgi:predicted DNA-binding ribbon-helix-helix protein